MNQIRRGSPSFRRPSPCPFALERQGSIFSSSFSERLCHGHSHSLVHASLVGSGWVIPSISRCRNGFLYTFPTQANNTKQQNPCEIAGALEAECGGFGESECGSLFFRSLIRHDTAEYVVGPLNPGEYYVAPQRNDDLAQKCECNTVMFRCWSTCVRAEQVLIDESLSLYMACSACQNASIQSWTSWSEFCSQVYVTQYPDDVPLDTAVPHWAYLNYTVCVLFLGCGTKPHMLTTAFRCGTRLILSPREPLAISQKFLRLFPRRFRPVPPQIHRP
jgi:hypothetical protein